jgi:uncharacterized protein (DUF952 family)
VSEPVFKIVSRAEWAEVTGAYEGSAHDRADGFLHFSTRMQLPETLKRYYAGQTDLMLVAVDTEKLGAHLKWEYSPSRGEDFPHLYGALPLDAVIWAKPIENGADGEFLLPG